MTTIQIEQVAGSLGAVVRGASRASVEKSGIWDTWILDTGIWDMGLLPGGLADLAIGYATAAGWASGERRRVDRRVACALEA